MEQKSKIEMHPTGGNNLCGAKEQGRDESGRSKVIPVVQKRKIEMHPAGGNHPCGAKEQDRDESRRGKVIPVVQKIKIDNMKRPHICSIADSPLYYV